MSIQSIRLGNLHALCRRYDTQAELARAIGTDDGTLSRYFHQKRRIGNDFARKVENALGLSAGWMDSPHPAAIPGGLLATMEAFVASEPPKNIADAIGALLEALTAHHQK